MLPAKVVISNSSLRIRILMGPNLWLDPDLGRFSPGSDPYPDRDPTGNWDL